MRLPLIVSHQLRSPDNLGSLARLMANFGYEELVLSDPATHDFRGAEKLGVGGQPVLEKMAVAPTLDEALSGAVYAVGTTSREALKRFTPLTPEAGVEKLFAHAARGKVALVLGGEKRGLSDDELSRCHDVVVIPTPGPQPSMNVSHAAAVMLYLCARRFSTEPSQPAEEEGAPLRLVQALEARLESALMAAEFLNPQAPGHVLKELTRALVRGGVSKRELELWLAAAVHLERAAKKPPRSGAS